MSVTAPLSSAKVFERANQEVEESMRPNREIENRVAVLMVVTKTLLLSPCAAVVVVAADRSFCLGCLVIHYGPVRN